MKSLDKVWDQLVESLLFPHRNAELLKELLSDPVRDKHEWTLLLRAVEKGHKEAVKRLLAAGADPNVRDIINITPLMYAANLGDVGIVRLLIKAGADLNAQEKSEGSTAKIFAVKAGYLDIVEILRRRGGMPELKPGVFKGIGVFYRWGLDKSWNDLLEALKSLHDNAELLEELSIDPVQDNEGRTLLLRAVEERHEDAVKHLLAAGADPNVRGIIASTPLMQAARLGDVGIVKLLLDSGANPNDRDKDGNTSLMVARHRGHVGVIKLLLQAGAEG